MGKTVPAAIAALIASGAAAVADDICEGGPRTQWMGEDTVQKVLAAAGFGDDYYLQVEDGCLEAKLVHEGRRIEVYMEPVTGEIVLVKED